MGYSGFLPHVALVHQLTKGELKQAHYFYIFAAGQTNLDVSGVDPLVAD